MSLADPQTGQETAERAQARIRWPHPTPTGTALMALWVVGLIVALLVPAFIVPPTALTAPKDQVIWATVITVIGSLLMLIAAFMLYRHSHEIGYAVLGGVPAASCLVGGIVLMAAKLTGNVGGVH